MKKQQRTHTCAKVNEEASVTCLRRRVADSVIAKVDAAYRLAVDRAVLLPLLQDVGERQCEVVLRRLQHEVLGVEVDQSVEEDTR